MSGVDSYHLDWGPETESLFFQHIWSPRMNAVIYMQGYSQGSDQTQNRMQADCPVY